jgi:plastocyanin
MNLRISLLRMAGMDAATCLNTTRQFSSGEKLRCHDVRASLIHASVLSGVFKALLGIVVLFSLGAAHAATANVSVINFAFSPATTDINVNDTVVWTWNGQNHNVVSTSSPQAWTASPVKSTPFSFTNKFTSAGSFPYICTVHGFTGTINVTAVSVPPPTVAIVSPTAGEVFTAPTNISVSATASDSGGTVTNVEFLLGTTVLTNVAVAPYSIIVSNVLAGDYTLTAIAANNQGARSTNSVSFSVVTPSAPPTVAIASPVTGEVFAAPANISASATASDTSGTITNVEFLLGTTVLTNVVVAPYSVVVSNVLAGDYTLMAIAVNSQGARSTNSVGFSVVTPVTSAIGKPQLASTNFVFTFNATVGLNYIVQATTNLVSTNWFTVFTNAPASNSVVTVQLPLTSAVQYYRVGRLPNP